MAILGSTKITDLSLLDGVIGNLNPVNTGVYDLGTNSLKWRMLYGNVTGDLTGNASSATKLKNGRTFQIKDADNTNAGNASSAFDGQNNLIINLPSTIKATLSGNAATATKLKTAKTIQTNLASTSSASFDGSDNITPGVTGILGIANGGTGNTSMTANRLIYSESASKLNSASSLYATTTGISVNNTSLESGYNFQVTGKSYLNNTTAASTSNTSSQLVVSNSNGGTVAVELWRNGNASWQLCNDGGVLYLRNNYTTAKQNTYSQNGMIMDYNTSNVSFAGKLSIGQTVRNTDYQLYVNSSVAKSIYLNTSHATASGKWNSIIQGYAPNMAAGSNTSIGGGQAASEYNSGFLQFHYTGSGSTSNYIGFGLNGHDYLIRCYGTGNVSIGADNNNYKLYVNGTSYFNGNTTHNGIDYFANGTTYYINNSGTANLNAITANGILKGSADCNFIAHGNEFNFVPKLTSTDAGIWLNYRQTGGESTPSNNTYKITEYIFGDGKGAQLAKISNGQFSGNAASATALETAGTTAQFYRGDNSWSNTLTGSFSATTITTTDQTAAAHINMSRTGGHSSPNYINIPASSALAFSVGGAGGSNIAAMVQSEGLVPYTTYTKNIGTDSYRWQTAYIGHIKIGGGASDNADSKKIISDSTLYIQRAASSSLIFNLDTTENARFNTSGHFIPGSNTYTLGISGTRWGKLFVGSTDTYGGGDQPIYWDNGVPKATNYALKATINAGTANQIAYYSSSTAISGKDSANGALYATSANGALTFGTLPVAQGGTGCTTLTSNEVLIGNDTGAITTRGIRNNTSIGHLGWTASATDTTLITTNTLAYWDGRYKDNYSNLKYCEKGTIGDSVLGNARVFYGTCSTDGATATKVVTLANSASYPSNTVSEGDICIVKFLNKNTAAVANLSLRVANVTANIKYVKNAGLANLPGAGYIVANIPYRFIYNGSAWVMDLYYNTDTNTQVRIYKEATDNDLPIISSRTAAGSITSGSTAVYGIISNDTTKMATINPSTGLVKTPGGILTNKMIVNTTDSYGSVLPSTGTEGQVFFQISTPTYELPIGGTTGQVLTKNSSTDRDVKWDTIKCTMVPDNSIKYYVIGSSAATQNSNNPVFNTAIYVENSVLQGAAWNDYAEFRQSDTLEPGRCVVENGDDTLSISTKRMQPGAEIISDTYGFSIGKTIKSNTPIAVAGRVLAYPYEDKEIFKQNIGKPVCSGPNGTVSIMTDQEYQEKGYCAIGFISAIPEYTTWGENQVEINNRIWIRVR